MAAEDLVQSTINAKLAEMAYSKVGKSRASYRPAYGATDAFMGGLKAEARLDLQVAKNMEDGAGMVRAAQAGVTGISSKLKQIWELANEAANKAGISSERFGQIQNSINTLTDEIVDLAKNTTFNSFSLLDGRMNAQGNAPVAGNGNLELQANNSQMNQKFTNLLDANAGADVMAADGSINLANLKNMINITDPTSAKAALDMLDPISERVAGVVGQYSYDIKNLSNMSVLMQNQADILTDAAKVHDPAKKSSSSSQDQILQDMLMNSLTGGSLTSALG